MAKHFALYITAFFHEPRYGKCFMGKRLQNIGWLLHSSLLSGISLLVFVSILCLFWPSGCNSVPLLLVPGWFLVPYWFPELCLNFVNSPSLNFLQLLSLGVMSVSCWDTCPTGFFLSFFFFFNFILFLNFTKLYLFCQIAKWIRHRYTCVPHPEPSYLLPPQGLLISFNVLMCLVSFPEGS